MDRVIIATDGGCRSNQTKNNIGAYAAILHYKGHKKIVSSPVRNTTNNAMEIKAVIEGLKALKRNDLPIEVHSDSAYVCNCINKKWYVSWRKNGWVKKDGKIVKNYELWKELIDLVESFDDILFVKVKGHSDNKLNEEADYIVNKTMDDMYKQ